MVSLSLLAMAGCVEPQPEHPTYDKHTVERIFSGCVHSVRDRVIYMDETVAQCWRVARAIGRTETGTRSSSTRTPAPAK